MSMSPAYAGSHGCKPWRNVQRVSSKALAKEDVLRQVSPKTPEGPRLSSREAPLLPGWLWSTIIAGESV
jgi:hypothetical protein